jgi:type VI secretion system secreted protein Hcp
MAYDAFLKIDAIAGDSADAQHLGWIHVLSFSWGATQPTYRSGSGKGAVGGTIGRATFQDFTIVKSVDKSTPTLLLDAMEGKVLKLVQLNFQTASDKGPHDIFALKFENCFISSVRMSGNNGADHISQVLDDLPLEEVSFVFSRMSLQQRGFSADGQPIDAYMGWDLLSNHEFSPGSILGTG